MDNSFPTASHGMRLPEPTSQCLSVCLSVCTSLSWAAAEGSDPGELSLQMQGLCRVGPRWSRKPPGSQPCPSSTQLPAKCSSSFLGPGWPLLMLRGKIPARIPMGVAHILCRLCSESDGWVQRGPGGSCRLCLPGAPGASPWEAPCRLQVFMGNRWCRGARVTPDCGVYGAQVAFTPSSLCGCNWGWGLCVLQRQGSWERLEGPRSPLLPDPASPEGQDAAGTGKEQGLALAARQDHLPSVCLTPARQVTSCLRVAAGAPSPGHVVGLLSMVMSLEVCVAHRRAQSPPGLPRCFGDLPWL